MIQILPFADADCALGLELSTAAGWNQTTTDWRRALELMPAIGRVGLVEGRRAGTVFAWIFGDVAWVGLMLVAPELRGRGVGRALMEAILDELRARHVATIRLDATPLGQPLYERLGFRVDRRLHRYWRDPGSSPSALTHRTPQSLPSDGQLRPLTVADLDRITALDQAATGAERRLLLACLLHERPQGAWGLFHNSELTGFSMQRAGRLATFLGPCIADAVAGPLLIDHVFRQQADTPFLVDVFDDHVAAVSLVRDYGLTPQRVLTRMTLGVPIPERVPSIWCSSGPEKG